jgi:eukaryotic-like serine/threonine-protein kinase
MPHVVGRYVLDAEVGAGGMATVHVGRLAGPEGFSRTVAIKRLRPQFAKDAESRSMFLDEARLAARIRHPNVASMLDVVAEDDEIFLVMEYVEGESLARLLHLTVAAGRRIAPSIVASVVSGVLYGLHAAHEVRDPDGALLGIVHRDVSPQNVVVGVDGIARVLDFGIAKAATSAMATKLGQVKGKLAYMAPEQLSGRPATRASDIFAAGIVLWEALTGERLFTGESEGELIDQVASCRVRAPSTSAPGIAESLDRVALRALARDPAARFQSAKEMALAIESAVAVAPPVEVGAWVAETAAEALRERAEAVARVERAAEGAPGLAARGGAVGRAATPPRTRRPRRGNLRTILLASALALAVALGVGLAARARTPASPAADAVESSLAATEEPLGSGAPNAPSASATSTPVAPGHPPRRRWHRPRSAGSCDPPYRVDANGQRHFKAECL